MLIHRDRDWHIIGCKATSKSDWSYSPRQLPCSLRHRYIILCLAVLHFLTVRWVSTLLSICCHSFWDSWEIRRFYFSPELRSDEIWNFYSFLLLLWFPQLISEHLRGAWDKLSQLPEPQDRSHVPFQVPILSWVKNWSSLIKPLYLFNILFLEL